MSKKDGVTAVFLGILVALVVFSVWSFIIIPIQEGNARTQRCLAAGYTGKAVILYDEYCFHLNGVAGDFIRVDQLGK